MRCIFRDGEESRKFLIRTSERFLARHTIDGYSGGDAAGAELASCRDAAAQAPLEDSKNASKSSLPKQNGALTRNGELTNGHANGFAVRPDIPEGVSAGAELSPT